MAKIPTYQTGQTAISDLPNVRQTSIASPELFVGISGARGIAEAGEGLARAGVAGMKYAGELQEKENIAVAKKAEAGWLTELSSWELQGKQKQGLNAATLPSLADDYFAESVKKYTEGMNDSQKAIFENIANRHAPSFKNSMYAHSAEQINKAQEDSFRSSLDAFQSRAAANPAAAADLRAETIRTMEAWGKIRGMDKATLDKAKLTETTKLHTSVIASLEQAGNMNAVKGYFYTHIDEIDGTKQTEIKKAIETSDRLGKVQKFVDDLVDNKKLDMKQSLDAVKLSFEGEDRKQAEIEIKQRFATAEAIIKDNQEKAYEQAHKIAIDQKGGRKAIPASVWNSMSGNGQDAIMAKLEGGARKTDSTVYGKIFRQSWQDPQAFLNRNLDLDIRSLSESDYQELLRLQASVKKDIDKPDKLKRVYTVGQQVSQIIDSVGIPATSNNKEVRDRRALATRAFSDAINRYAASNGKEVDQLSDEEVQKIGDQVLIKGTVSRDYIWGKDKYAFELKPEEKAKFRVDFDQVPADFVTEARAFAKSKGKKISDEDIAIKYRDWLNKQ